MSNVQPTLQQNPTVTRDFPEIENRLRPILSERGQARNAPADLSPTKILDRVRHAQQLKATGDWTLSGYCYVVHMHMQAFQEHFTTDPDTPVTPNEVVSMMGMKKPNFNHRVGCVQTLIDAEVEFNTLRDKSHSHVFQVVPFLSTQNQSNGVLSCEKFRETVLPRLVLGEIDEFWFEQLIRELRTERQQNVDPEQDGNPSDSSDKRVILKAEVLPTTMDMLNAAKLVGIKNQEWHSLGSCLDSLILRYTSAYATSEGGEAKITSLRLGIEAFEKGHKVKVLVIDDLNHQESHKEVDQIRVYRKKAGGYVCASNIKLAAKYSKCPQKDLEELPVDFSPLWGTFFGETEHMVVPDTDPKAADPEVQAQADREIAEIAEKMNKPLKASTKSTAAKKVARNTKAKASKKEVTVKSKAVGKADSSVSAAGAKLGKTAKVIAQLKTDLGMPPREFNKLVKNIPLEAQPNILRATLENYLSESDAMFTELKEDFDDEPELKKQVKEALADAGKGAYAKHTALSNFFED